MSEEQTPSQPGQQEPIKERPTKRVKALPPEQAFYSYWPFLLALALMVALIGLLIQPVVLGIGVVLAAAAIIGWGLERR